ncbi:unnamed protein product [Cylicocyclus nassatus]|uniref:Ionotropic glutamate receptor C-terminal domain-containing protein n=1 Tax=Cylicocyclus nassatus TaxID=53992 RepID=A0AA36GN58_CYLNA|nr:unnamed protein product [Cylicocyclus nassatus]
MDRFMQESKLPSSVEEAIQRVRDPKEDFAYIDDATVVKYAAYTDCQLEQIGTEFSRKPYAIAVQSGHILKDRISSAILKLLNQRKLETLKEKWWNNNPNKAICADTSDESDGISIQNIGGVFIVILGGIVISVITLCIEYFYQRKSSVHDLENHNDVEERKETNGASLASLRYHNNSSGSANHNNHATSFAADNAGFQY